VACRAFGDAVPLKSTRRPLNRRYAHGAAWGVAVHFVFSSGVAKLRAGGGARGWAAPGTMTTRADPSR
jgi:hypothetical protein